VVLWKGFSPFFFFFFEKCGFQEDDTFEEEALEVEDFEKRRDVDTSTSILGSFPNREMSKERRKTTKLGRRAHIYVCVKMPASTSISTSRCLFFSLEKNLKWSGYIKIPST
jgi:hypothetical protein